MTCLALILIVSTLFIIQNAASYPQGDYMLAFIPVEDYNYIASMNSPQFPVTYALDIEGVYMEPLSYGAATSTGSLSVVTACSTPYKYGEPTVTILPYDSVPAPTVTPIVAEYITPEYATPAPAVEYIVPQPAVLPEIAEPEAPEIEIEIEEVVNAAITQNIDVTAINSNPVISESISNSALEFASSPVITSSVVNAGPVRISPGLESSSLAFGGTVPASGCVRIFASYC